MPIYLRITVDGIPKEIATKRNCDTERWNIHAQRSRGTNEDARSLNAFLDTLERQVHNIRKSFLENDVPVSSEAIKNKLNGQADKGHMLLEIFAMHNNQLRTLQGREYAPGTIKRYSTALAHVKAFILWKYNLSDIQLKQLSFSFITDYEFWLKSQKKCNHNSAIKYICNLRKIVNYCIRNCWLLKDPFFGFKMTKKEVIRDFLTADELKTMELKSFEVERLSQVRDVFLFSCYTGLAFIDVYNLKWSNVGIGIDGGKWIFTSRQKTDTPSRIPLLSKAEEIIEKYKDHPKCNNENRLLPMSSNQKMNAYLKEVAVLCGISKQLTFHIARHTFATTVTLSNGVPIESVSKMLGHKSIRITQLYAKILDRKVSDDMLALREKLNKMA